MSVLCVCAELPISHKEAVGGDVIVLECFDAIHTSRVFLLECFKNAQYKSTETYP